MWKRSTMPLVCGLLALVRLWSMFFDGEVELVFVALVGAAIFGAAIGEHPLQHDAVLLVERDHPVVEQIGGGDRRLAVVELGEADLGVGVDEGLLVDAADALQRADIERVLRAAIAGAFGLELAMGLLVGLGLLQRGELASVRISAPAPSWPRAPSAGASWSPGRGAARSSAPRTARR